MQEQMCRSEVTSGCRGIDTVLCWNKILGGPQIYLMNPDENGNLSLIKYKTRSNMVTHLLHHPNSSLSHLLRFGLFLVQKKIEIQQFQISVTSRLECHVKGRYIRGHLTILLTPELSGTSLLQFKFMTPRTKNLTCLALEMWNQSSATTLEQSV